MFEVDPDANSASLELYAAVCSPEERHECVVAKLNCAGRYDFNLEMTGFDDDDLGRWMLLNGAILTMKNGPNTLPMRPVEILANDLDGGWWVRFQPSSSWVDWSSQYKADLPTVLDNIQEDLVLPSGEAI